MSSRRGEPDGGSLVPGDDGRGSNFTRHLRLGDADGSRDAPLSSDGRYWFRLVLTVVVVGGVALIAFLLAGR